MAYVAKNTASVFVSEEVTEGTAPALVGTDAVSVLADGLEMNGEKELVERTNLTSSIGKALPRVGMKSGTGTIAVEAKAALTEGAAPEADLLFKGALGGKRSIATTTTTKATGNTGTTLALEDADIAKFNVGDIVIVKQSGATHISPIISKVTTIGSASITLLIAKESGNFANSVVISKATTYYTTNSGHPSLSATMFLEDAIKMQLTGTRVTSLSLEGFETGQLASFNFGLQGMDYSESLAASGVTATYDAALPPLVLSACVYESGVQIPVNSFAVSLENTVGKVTSTCSPNGTISQRITERAITGSFNPYMDTTSVDWYTKFNANTEFSLFCRLWNPNTNAGEYKEAMGIYIPKCIVTAQPKADQDGVMQYNIEFSVGEPTDGTSALYISFI